MKPKDYGEAEAMLAEEREARMAKKKKNKVPQWGYVRAAQDTVARLIEQEYDEEKSVDLQVVFGLLQQALEES